MESLSELENQIFAKYSGDKDLCNPIFILGSPRTGSTFLYQLMINAFELPYVSNFINNNYSDYPVIGFLKQKNYNLKVPYKSFYGKTQDIFHNSEGSGLFKNWFGGDHPSQTCSKDFLIDKVNHFVKTNISIQKIYNKKVLYKNAWNCYRIKAIKQIFKNAHFIWLKRNLIDASLSDYIARIVTKNNLYSWNSATPSNLEDLLKHDPYIQCIENQYEMNKFIQSNLKKYCDNYLIIDYQNLENDLDNQINLIGKFISNKISSPNLLSVFNRSNNYDEYKDVYEIMQNYISENNSRFSFLIS